MKRSDRYFAFLLGLLPASFRERHGDELGPLLERMKDELGPCPSRLALLRLYVAATWDLIRQSPWLSQGAGRVSESRARRWGLGGFSLVDVKLGVRMLRKQPLLTGVAMLALGLAIPASLGMHHVIRTLHAPLPVPEGDRVMGIRQWDRELSDPVLSSVHDLG